MSFLAPLREKGLHGSWSFIDFLVLVLGRNKLYLRILYIAGILRDCDSFFDGGERATCFNILYFQLFQDEISSGVAKSCFHDFLIFWHLILPKGPYIYIWKYIQTFRETRKKNTAVRQTWAQVSPFLCQGAVVQVFWGQLAGHPPPESTGVRMKEAGWWGPPGVHPLFKGKWTPRPRLLYIQPNSTQSTARWIVSRVRL